MMTIDFLGYKRINHAPYSPDFAVYPMVKGKLCGRRFETLDGLGQAVRSEVVQYEPDWYPTGYQKWVECYEKCGRADSKYFERL